MAFIGDGRNVHSANILSEIDAALEESGVRLEEIELFAAASGPGSFTGLRAGIATVKAFAAAFTRPVVGVPTLRAVAQSAGVGERVLASIPAGRGEVFAQLFAVTEDGGVADLSRAEHLSPDALVKKYSSLELKWVACGSDALAELVVEHARREGIELSESFAGRPSKNEAREKTARGWIVSKPLKNIAMSVASLALVEFRAGRAGAAGDLRAIYVRPSDAELNEKCRA